MANKSFTIQYLIKARDQFSRAAEKTRKASESMRASIERTKKAFIAASAKMRKASKAMSGAVTLPIALMAHSLKNAASDAEETRSKFATVFRDISRQSDVAATNLSQNFGLAGTKALQLLSDTGDLLTGFGFSQESALKLSTQVNELAVDLASFTNFSGGAQGASEALTKALLGERESLKSLGVAISEKDVKAKISQLLAKGQRFQTLRQAKAHATLALALEQSGNAIGDFARTSGDLANQERITSARIQDLKESFGQLLLPVALKITQAIRGVVERLNDLSPGAKKVIVNIGGIAAAIGPLLLVVGSIALIVPALTAGFAAFGAVAAVALGPVGLLAVGIALGAFAIIRNWSKVETFFKGFSVGIPKKFGPTMTRLVGQFKEAAKIIAELFSSDSEAAQNLTEFASLGDLIGTIIGGTLDLIVRGISGMGAIIGQLIGAFVTLDFGQFDTEAIKAEFLGTKAETSAAQAQVNVGVNVGLDPGLKQTGAARVEGAGVRRVDVGGSA